MIPTQMNCSHSGDGWCLQCVQELDEKHMADIATLTAALKQSEQRIAELQKAGDWAVWLLENDPVKFLLDRYEPDWGDPAEIHRMLVAAGCVDPSKRAALAATGKESSHA